MASGNRAETQTWVSTPKIVSSFLSFALRARAAATSPCRAFINKTAFHLFNPTSAARCAALVEGEAGLRLEISLGFYFLSFCELWPESPEKTRNRIPKKFQSKAGFTFQPKRRTAPHL